MSDCSITSGSWVAQTTAAPVSRARRASRIATEIAFAPSSREVGSSASRSERLRVATARAIATRARSPCESRATRWVARSDRPDRVERGERGRPRLVAAPEGQCQLDVLERREVRHEARLLADVRDLLAAERARARRGRVR